MKIDIKEDIFKRLQQRVDSTDEFSGVEEYVNYILEQVVERLSNGDDKEDGEEPVFSKEDEEKVKERLRGLGYLD